MLEAYKDKVIDDEYIVCLVWVACWVTCTPTIDVGEGVAKGRETLNEELWSPRWWFSGAWFQVMNMMSLSFIAVRSRTEEVRRE